MKTKLLYVIDALQFGGGERVFAQIINGLPQEQYKIFLASCSNEQFLQALGSASVDFFSTDFSRRLNFYLIPRLTKIIKKNGISIVHGQGARAEFYARLASKLAGTTKYVSTIAMPVEGFDVGPVRKGIYRFFDRFSERFVDRFLVVSDALRDAIIAEHGIPAEKVTRIYNGIEIEHYSPQKDNGSREAIRHDFKVEDDAFLIGAIGRLVWQKGFAYLIRAIPSILQTFPRTKLLLVGDGPLRLEMEALSENLKIDEHVIFTGFRADVRRILSAIDILVVPSLLEGFPMITLEGMAMAKPIIATKIAGIEEQILNGKSGILVPPEDPNAIAEASIKLRNEESFAHCLGLEARRTVEERFTVEKMVENTEKAYLSVFGIH
jgi:glycosyltransferase involved in cell wall biosynthesis